MTGTDTQAVITAGDIVTARPWVAGYEQAARKGLVLAIDGDYLVVWFRSMGPLTSDESGNAVQAILPSKAKVAGHVAQYADRALVTLTKTVRDSGYHASGPLFAALVSIARSRSLV